LEQIAQQTGDPGERQELRSPRVDRGGFDTGAVLHPPRRPSRCHRLADLSTLGTLHRDQLVLDDHRPTSGQLDHLPPLPPVLTAVAQIGTTCRTGAPLRPVPHDPVRVLGRP
jgi:hypothetical protein